MSHSIESFLDPATCEAVIGAVNDFVDRAYTPERCRLRQAYVYEYRLGMEAFAFAVHCPGSQETRHLPGFGLEELPQPLPRIFREVCARMGLSRGRVLFNVARYPEDSPPVAAHFDGELFEFELRPDGGPGGHFLLPRADFAEWAATQKPPLRMDVFYRHMRKRFGVLLEGQRPTGGKWSLDADNRKRIPADAEPPAWPGFPPDGLTQEVMRAVAGWAGHWGEVDGFDWPVTRAEALSLLEDFVEHRLPRFGDYQDGVKLKAHTK